MDVTPQVINEVEFHSKMRGYDPDEVDDFERIAVAVGQLTERLHESEARAAAADRRAIELDRKVRELGERPASRDDDETETIRRTLVLAQKTADAAVKEAQDEAQRTIAESRQTAEALLSDAQETSRRLVDGAEAEARKASDETRQRVVDEIVALEEARDALKADHGILERHLEDQRLRLRSSISDLQALLDDPAKLRVISLPDLSGATRPLFDDDEIAAAAPAVLADDVIDLADDSGGRVQSGTDGDIDVERPITGGVSFSPPEDAGGGVDAYGSHSDLASDDEADTDAWSRFVREEMLDRPTAAVSLPEDDDAYLVELRKAMLEDSGSVGTGEPPSRTRFGRRR